MAWTIPTFVGAEATGSPSGWRTTMFEFCRAINEREECFPLVKTEFRKADGTLGSDLPIDSFLGMDPAGSYALENWESIMEWILTNLSSFTTTSGGITPWTRVALEEDIDMFSFLSRPRSTTDALFFQQCKEAFDRLIYSRIGIGVTPNTPVIGYYASRKIKSGFSLSSLQDGWDEMIADDYTEIGMGGLIPMIGWGVEHLYFESSDIHRYNAVISYDVKDISVNVPDFKGVVAAAYQSVFWTRPFYRDGDGELIATMQSSFLGNTYSIPSMTGNTTIAQSKLVSLGGLSRGEINKLDWPSNTPSMVPFSAPDENYKAEVTMNLSSISAYVDIAGELTDQA